MSKKSVLLYTDGACLGNPGPGGWGGILRYGKWEKELSGGEDETTNNRMELMAAIAGLEALKEPQGHPLFRLKIPLRRPFFGLGRGLEEKGWKRPTKAGAKRRFVGAPA